MHHKKLKPILPDELVDEILLSLRAKTLLRLQCVCKSWHDKIKSPAFIKQHVERSSIVSISFLSSSPRGYIIQPVKIRYVVPRYLRSFNLDNLAFAQCIHPLPVDPDTKIYIDVVGACNGLVCYALNNGINDGDGWIFLFNPSTRTHKLITAPQGAILQPCATSSGMVLGIRAPVTMGFGYDNINDDYVVVSIFWIHQVTCFYSLKSNSWKEHKSNCPLLFNNRLTYINPRGGYMNNAMYWYVTTKFYDELMEMKYHISLVKLNFQSLQYSVIPLESNGYKYFYGVSFDILGERCFSLRSLHGSNYWFEIWVKPTVDGGSLQDSWTRLVRVTAGEMLCRFDQPVYPIIYIQRASKLLLVTTCADSRKRLVKFFWYDLSTRQPTSIRSLEEGIEPDKSNLFLWASECLVRLA